MGSGPDVLGPRRRFGVTVLVVRPEGPEAPAIVPRVEHELEAVERVVLMGREENMQRVRHACP